MPLVLACLLLALFSASAWGQDLGQEPSSGRVSPAAIQAPSMGPNEAFLRSADRLKLPQPHPALAQGYDFTAGLYKRLAAVIREWPGHVQAIAAGRSVDGRTIWAFKVHAPGQAVQKRVLIFAQLHALEWMGAEVAVAFLEQVIPHPPPGLELTVVPIANPDGRAYAESDLLQGRDRAYRRGNANGVDLNRDWAVHRENDVIWSRLPYTRRYYYSSPEPLSQPETQTIDRLAQQGVDVSVSLHAYGGYIYVPWAGRWEQPEDYARMRQLGEVMAEAQPGRAYRVMQLCHWIFFFRALGTELDHMYGVYGADSFLIELTRSGLRLRDPQGWRQPFRWYNPEDKAPHVADGVGALMGLVRELSYGPP